MKAKKLVMLLFALVMPALVFAQAATDANQQAAPETIFWIIGAVLVVLLIFMVILALAKGTMALSENIGDQHQRQDPTS